MFIISSLARIVVCWRVESLSDIYNLICGRFPNDFVKINSYSLRKDI